MKPLLFLPVLALAAIGSTQAGQIKRVQFLPDRPSPYELRDWDRTARAMHSLFFDPDQKGPLLPITWLVGDNQYGTASYVGNEKQRGDTGEGICQLGALLGSVAEGMDVTAGHDWLSMSAQFYSPSEGLVLNNVGGHSGDTFWYELLPSLDLVQISSRNPSWLAGRIISKKVAYTWIGGIDALHGDFDHTAYNFTTKKAFDNKEWVEPDAAGGVAYLELEEGLRSGDQKYFEASKSALRSFETRTTNPTYEILTPYGAVAAAYLNAEKGENFDVPRFTNWCFEPTAPQRAGWGMVVGKWGDYDTGGLMGSISDGGGYAFAMNTFVSAGTLAPVARYDDRFSADIAKWILNLSNAARLFYSDSLPTDHQSSAFWKGDPEHGIAYEGLHRNVNGNSPYATGDAIGSKSATTDFGLYGSGYVGLLAALVHPTNVPEILRIDLRATDFLTVKAYQTDLYWNPYDESKTVDINLGINRFRLYDAVSNQLLTGPVTGTYAFKLEPKQAAQIVMLPAKGEIVFDGGTSRVNGIAIDYANGRVPARTHTLVVPVDESVKVRVGKTSGAQVDWSRVKSDPIELGGGDGSKMRAELRLAWDDSYLYFQFRQTAKATETLEPTSVEELTKHWWDFEAVAMDLDPGRGMYSVAAVPDITFGWSSSGMNDLFVCPNLAIDAIHTQTTGTAAQANRTIEGKIAWADLNHLYGVKGTDRWPTIGGLLGCQPLLVDGTFKRQAYIGGMRYRKPSGLDKNSRTLILSED